MIHCYYCWFLLSMCCFRKYPYFPIIPSLAAWKVYQFTGLNISLKVLTVFFRLQDPPPCDLFNDCFWCGDWTVSGNIQFYLMLWGLGNFLGRGEGGNGGKYASEVFKPPPFLRQNLYILLPCWGQEAFFGGLNIILCWRTSPLFLKFGVNDLF